MSDNLAYQELLALFETSEAKIKTTETITGEGLVVPSINELRYAGHHIVRGLLQDDPTLLEQEIKRATDHVKRSIYDTDEVLLLYYLSQAIEFKKLYGNNGFTTEVIPDYVKHLVDLDAANQNIQTLRNDKTKYQTREAFYTQCEPHIQQLDKVISIFEQAAPMLAQKQQEKEKDDQKNSRRFWTGITVSVAAILIAIVFGVFTI